MLKNKNKAFTIIELLIVISIIGVLAGLVITNFQNAQRKARNTVRTNAIDAYVNAFVAYAVDNGQYPYMDNCHFAACLGIGHKDVVFATGTGDCLIDGNAPTSENAAFMDLIRPYIGSTDPISDSIVRVNSQNLNLLGGYYITSRAATLDGVSNFNAFYYNLEGRESECSEKGNILNYAWPSIVTLDSKWSASYYADDYTRCVIGLPVLDA